MIEHTLHSISFFIPEIILVITLCVLIVADMAANPKSQIGGWILLVGLLLAGVFTVLQSGATDSVFYDMIAADPFSRFFKILLILAGLFVVLFSMQNNEFDDYKERMGEYYMLITGMMIGMFFMVSSTNLLLLYLAFEVTSISSYVLAGFTKRERKSAEASMKYIIYGAVSSGVMLYGLSLLVGVTASTDIYAINEALTEGIDQYLILNISIVMIMVGMGFKIAVVPFHFWAPDVYEGAPITVTAILAVGSKIAAFGLLIRFFTIVYVDSSGISETGIWSAVDGVHWDILLGGMAALAMIVGNLTALRQDNIKRMLAYSSIAHAGYLLMGLVILAEQGISSILIYLFIYLFMNLGAFYVAMLFSNRFKTESIKGYKGLGFRAPLQSVGLTIFLVSLTGLPPTGGFIAKLYIFGAAVSGGWIWLVAVAGITTIISLFYYIRVVRNMFFFRPEGEADKVEFGYGSTVVLMLLLIPTLILGIYFEPVLEFAKLSIQMFGV
ncbi:MAG TPA: NADH-quinone oxidoreductase subunit N [Balneolaceae bacterium]|nr:NADH-quinone oxidoreductase subunit N [Balneolaceae bacterium]